MIPIAFFEYIQSNWIYPKITRAENNVFLQDIDYFLIFYKYEKKQLSIKRLSQNELIKTSKLRKFGTMSLLQ